MQSKTISLSIIVSVYNEQDVICEFWKNLRLTILESLKDYSCQVIIVNDGSVDNSQRKINTILKENNSTNIHLTSIEFSKNFGHEAAMIAGIDSSNDDIIICMDSDLQHPPSIIPEMLKKNHAGYDIVLMNRRKRHDKNFINNSFSKLFYHLIDFLSDTNFENNASDFFLISSKVATVLKTEYRERNRFLRGYIQIIGFNLCTLDFEAPARFAGKSNYSFKSLIKLGLTAIFAFSNKPLYISLFFAIIFLFFSISVMVYSLSVYFFGDTPPTGYTTLILFQSVGFTVLCILISILSIYFGKSLSEIRDRPIYIIKNKHRNNESKLIN